MKSNLKGINYRKTYKVSGEINLRLKVKKLHSIDLFDKLYGTMSMLLPVIKTSVLKIL